MFFQKIDPTVVQAAYKNTDKNIQFLNYTFTDIDGCATKLDIKEYPDYVVYVDDIHCDSPYWSKVTTVNFANGDPAFKIQEYDGGKEKWFGKKR